MTARVAKRARSEAGLGRHVAKIRTLVDDRTLVAANRRLLAETATQLFHSKGYHKTSTREIAIAAGMSAGAVYQYIRHKEDLIVLILKSVVEIYEERIYPLAQAGRPARERLWQAVDVYYHTLDEHHAKTDVLYHEFSGLSRQTKTFLSETEEEVSKIVRSILDQGIASGDFLPVNPHFTAHAIVSMGHMWALKRGRFRNIMTVDDYVAEQQRHLGKILLGR